MLACQAFKRFYPQNFSLFAKNQVQLDLNFNTFTVVTGWYSLRTCSIYYFGRSDSCLNFSGAAIPIFTVDPENDEILLPHLRPCPSFFAESANKHFQLAEEILANHSAVYTGFQEITGF
jgi:hypothetical protein